MRREFEKGSYQFKRVYDALLRSDFSEWEELVVWMKNENEEMFVHENTTIWFYQDDGYYYLAIVENLVE